MNFTICWTCRETCASSIAARAEMCDLEAAMAVMFVIQTPTVSFYTAYHIFPMITTAASLDDESDQFFFSFWLHASLVLSIVDTAHDKRTVGCTSVAEVVVVAAAVLQRNSNWNCTHCSSPAVHMVAGRRSKSWSTAVVSTQ